jgi:uncharacterized protein
MKKILCVIAVIATSSGVFAASFDCGKATTPTEKAICSSKKLSLLDEIMVYQYKTEISVTNDKNKVISSQREWIKNERNICGANDSCLVDAYESRLGGSADISSLDKFFKSDGWSKGKYLPGTRFCTQNYSRGSEKVVLTLYCAGDGFSDISLY